MIDTMLMLICYADIDASLFAPLDAARCRRHSAAYFHAAAMLPPLMPPLTFRAAMLS